MSAAYKALYHLLGSNRLFSTTALSLCHSVPVFAFQCGLFILDYFSLLKECISQPGRPTDDSLGKQCWIQILINHFVVMPIALWFVYIVLQNDISPDTIPSTTTVIRHLLICALLEDFFFYWSHRILHHPFLYKRFHKQHHEFKVLTGYPIASEYTHPFESVIGNIFPVMIGPFLTSCHMYTVCLWIILRMLKTCDAHSGYSFKYSPFGLFFPLNPSTRHDFHHETGLGSYGSFFLFWDTICGTDADYLVHSKKREEAKKKRQ